MRWASKGSKQAPKEGDHRIVDRFLFFPKCIDDEWRWLEFASIGQKCKMLASLSPDPSTELKYPGWVDVGWILVRNQARGTCPPKEKHPHM